jgi:predicted metal-dependent hydrolase
MKDVTPHTSKLRGPRKDYLNNKERARTLVQERLVHYAERYALTYGRVSIKNMTSRWGSCSGKGNLNFHYKVVELPPDLLDYLVVHELCHRTHMNHGPQFWALVAETIPNYALLRLRLRALYR